MHGIALRLRYLHAASACSLSRPAKRARKSTLSPFSVRSVKGSALPSRPLALLCAASRRCLASFSSGKAPIWISQPPRGLLAGGVVDTGTLPPADATRAGGAASSAAGCGADGVETGEATAATGAAGVGEARGDEEDAGEVTDEADAGDGTAVGAAEGGSFLTVAIVVTFAALAAGVSWRLPEGTGVSSDAVYIMPGWTATVRTVTGLIGSVEPGAGPSIAEGAD